MDFQLTPCEEKLVVPHSRRSVSFGILAEDGVAETRVPLTPQGVEIFVAQGHRVVVQRGLGLAARFSDESYASAGAEVVGSVGEVLESDVIVKVSPPSGEQAGLMRKGQTLVCLIGRNEWDSAPFAVLSAKKVSVIAADAMVDAGSAEPALSRSLGQMEGVMAITTAAHLLEQTNGGKGVMIGGVTGVPPTEIVIIGADAAALCATRAASALGAYVKVFDTSLAKLHAMDGRLPDRVFTSVLHPQALTKALRSADILICTRRPDAGGQCFCVPADYLALIKHDAVVIDLDVVAGGRTELSRPTDSSAPTFRASGLFFHCLPDITVLAPHTASIIISDVVSPVLSLLAAEGGVDGAARVSPSMATAVAMYRGTVTNKALAARSGLEYYDLRLLLV